MLQKVAGQKTNQSVLDGLALILAEIVSENGGIGGADLMRRLKEQSPCPVNNVDALNALKYAQDQGLVKRRENGNYYSA